MQTDQIVVLKVSEINAENRLREDYQDIEDLMESIENHDQDIPIIVNQNMRLVAGGRRLEAHLRLKKETIKAIVRELTDDEAMALEIRENTKHRGFTFTEKIKITKILQSKIGERRGRGKRPQDVDSDNDKNVQNSSLIFGEKTRDYIVKEVGWGSHDTMSKALTIASNTKEYVHEALNKGLYSIHYAYRIATSPKKKQLTMHNEAISDPSTDSNEFNKSQADRRKAKRKAKLNIPPKHFKKQIFNVIRVVVDRGGAEFNEILDLPINDYASPDIAVVAVECSAYRLPNAFECLDRWGFDYAGLVTVYNPKSQLRNCFEFTHDTTCHIVLGKRVADPIDDKPPASLKTVSRTEPVLSRYSNPLESSLIPIIEELFPNGDDKRIDMSSDKKRRNWICWKNSYGISEEPEEVESCDQINAFEQAETVDDGAVETEQDDTDESLAEVPQSLEDEELFEVDEVNERDLRLY